jgi:hypothetical protein
MEQAEIKRQKQREQKDEPYDPEKVWNIEKPERKVQERAKMAEWHASNKAYNDANTERIRKERADEKHWDKINGKEMDDHDNDQTLRERQLHEMKRQLFAQEMMDSWNKQRELNKKMKEIENEK